jgi:hypothetical protein
MESFLICAFFPVGFLKASHGLVVIAVMKFEKIVGEK